MRPTPHLVDDPSPQRVPEPGTEAQPVEHEQGASRPPAARAWSRLTLKHQRAGGERIPIEDGMWSLLGGLLLLVGVITFFRFLAAAQVAGGCCGGGLVVLAGVIFLVIGVRDRGEFSW